MKAKRTPRLAAAIAAASLTLVAGLAGTAAHAAPPAGTGANGGTLTLSPATAPAYVAGGSTLIDGNLIYPTFTTSGGCAAGSDGYQVVVKGPGVFGTSTDPIYMIANSKLGVSTTSAFTTENAGSAILDLQHDLGGSSSTNLAGEYDITLNCIDTFTLAVKSTFTTALNFSSPTAYTSFVPSTKPVVTQAATASGSYKVGATQTCSAAFSGATSVGYAWLSNGARIAGAGSSKFTPTAAQYNKSVSCQVTGTSSSGSTVTTSAAHKTAIGAKPVVRKAPVIAGTAKYKKTVTVGKGTWSVPALSYSYQWKSNGKAIKGATKAKYKIAKKYKGKKLTVTVTVKKAGYTTATVTTKAKKVAK